MGAWAAQLQHIPLHGTWPAAWELPMAFRNIGILPMVGVVFAVLGVVAPITWEWYRTRSSLDVRLLGRAEIIKRADGLDSIRVMHGSRTLRNVSKVSFSVANSG